MAQFYLTERHLPYIDQGELKGVKWQPLAKPEDYVVHVDEDSFQVRSKTMLQRLVMGLAKMGLMPPGRVLKFLEIPDADAIAAELKEYLAMAAAAKQKVGGKGRK